MIEDIFIEVRNSRMKLGEVYFWTDTINEWKHLLKPDKYKQLVLNQWKDLKDKNLFTIYGFVVMPNHLHVLWELNGFNGHEMPHASFNKATSHLIIKDLKAFHINVLAHFKVTEKGRSYRVWQRDPLAVLMDSKSKFEQKLDYIHNNPLGEKWNLAKYPEEYYWSSAKFYETGIDDFGILTHYCEKYG